MKSIDEQISEAIAKNNHYLDGESFIVCSPEFAHLLIDEVKKSGQLEKILNPELNVFNVKIEYMGMRVLVVNNFDNFQILTAGRKKGEN
jgi:hypothetical protein